MFSIGFVSLSIILYYLKILHNIPILWHRYAKILKIIIAIPYLGAWWLFFISYYYKQYCDKYIFSYIFRHSHDKFLRSVIIRPKVFQIWFSYALLVILKKGFTNLHFQQFMRVAVPLNVLLSISQEKNHVLSLFYLFTFNY